MLTALSDVRSCEGRAMPWGGKATALGVLLREGLPVPAGFVVPPDERHDVHSEIGVELRAGVAYELERMGHPAVAVRSSAMDEDAADTSAAGQYESIIGVRGADEVCKAIGACRASAGAARVEDYWRRIHGRAYRSGSGMAVLVQRMVEAEVSGVMFTPESPGGSTRIEASWGLGLAVVGGTITPDAYEVASDGGISRRISRKQNRADLKGADGGVTVSTVREEMQIARTLNDDAVVALRDMGSRAAAILGGPQDIEWALADGAIWILQARPVTASPPASRALDSVVPTQALIGVPGAHGVVTAAARIVRSPSGFAAVAPGEIVVCPYTDPAWAPLFGIAAGVITEVGGALSHAAIVAREYGVPAVLGVANATNRIRTGDRVALDGAAGTVVLI